MASLNAPENDLAESSAPEIDTAGKLQLVWLVDVTQKIRI